MRLGLNSGEVVVVRVGEDLRLDPTALGHTVGLAQRMESMAEAGTTYLTEHTARLVEGWFHLRDLGLSPVKGVRELLRVYVLESASASPPVQRGGAALGSSPLVGRERELAVLEDALAAAAEGQAQVLGVVGEAGVGKTRLCEEFAHDAADRSITVRRTTGVSHGRDIPLLPILALLRDYFAITDTDDAGQARDRVAQRVLGLDPALVEALPLLFDFLEVPDPAQPAPQLAPEVRMRRIFEALRRLTQRRSEREVLILVVEDLHWFDAQSEAFLERLIESIPGSRTLVVANFRPDFSARWMRHSYYRQLPVAPLPDAAVGELLGELLGMDQSPVPLLGFVQDWTGGNPFFVEEVVRSLVEDGTLAGAAGGYRLTRPLHELKVPASVQAVLAARIDRLPPEHKALLQTASVIGRTFDTAVLAVVSSSSADVLEDALAALCAAELLQEAGHDPTTEYRFWHPLTQEVAYGSLLRDRRGRLHGAVARALVILGPERLDENAALIAQHFEANGDHLETARWQMMAARWTLRNDVAEAQRRWRSAITHLDAAPQTGETLRLGVQARSLLLRLGARTGMDAAEAETHLQAAKAAAEHLDDPASRMLATFARGSIHFWRGDVADALQCYLEAIRLSDETADPGLRAMGRAALSVVAPFIGPVVEGLDAAQRVLDLCRGDPLLGAEVAGFSMHDVARFARVHLFAVGGRLHDARQEMEPTLAYFDERPLAEYRSWTLSLVPSLAYWSGETSDVSSAVDEALGLAYESGNSAGHCIALQAQGVARLMEGQPDAAENSFRRALTTAREQRSGLFEEGSLLSYIAQARLHVAEPEAALGVAEEAVNVARQQRARVVECLALLTRARAWRAMSRTDDAEADLADALTSVKQTGALTFEPFILEERGRLRRRDGDLRDAVALYQNIGATGQARRLAADLERPSPAASVS